MALSPQPADHFGVQRRFDLPGVGLAIVDIEDSGTNVGWHFHENPHLTFILRGDVIEGTKQDVYHCSAGKLLFHGAFEPHYNKKLEGTTRCLHIDFAQGCLAESGIQINNLHGIFSIQDPEIKIACYKLFSEAVIADDLSDASMHTLSLQILSHMLFETDLKRCARPSWVGKVEKILQDESSEKLSLVKLSQQLAVHPVHVSRSFAKYFHCTLGEYVRRVRIERSLALMPRKTISLTEIAATCGFADQSHFTRSFKGIMGVSPSSYRKLLAN